MHRFLLLAALTIAATSPAAAQTDPARPHNVVLFVADGLRFRMVDDSTAPTLAALAREGVTLRNGHALFPTFTTANASAFATGHMLGDTGDFSNTIYAGFEVPAANASVTPFLENDAVLGEVDEHFAGNYLDEATILKLARDKGYSTASIGKIGPVLIFDSTARSGEQTIIVDDATGSGRGIPLSAEMTERLNAANLPAVTPPRGANRHPGTLTPNIVQQEYFAAVTTKAILPLFRERERPFILVYWSRDPDGTQHYQGDSPNALVPGINGPTSLAVIRNADDNLAQIRAALRELGLLDSTDIITVADHGFSTISKESRTSTTVKSRFAGTPEGQLPPGFVALDLAAALDLPLLDPDDGYKAVAPGTHPNTATGFSAATKPIRKSWWQPTAART
jgi:arylsulfatase A-like enzyme